MIEFEELIFKEENSDGDNLYKLSQWYVLGKEDRRGDEFLYPSTTDIKDFDDFVKEIQQFGWVIDEITERSFSQTRQNILRLEQTARKGRVEMFLSYVFPNNLPAGGTFFSGVDHWGNEQWGRESDSTRTGFETAFKERDPDAIFKNHLERLENVRKMS